MEMRADFASDNTAGMCPEALQALVEANAGYAGAYGSDDYSVRAAQAVRTLFETDCEVFFVFNGTAANALSLAAICQPYHGVICHAFAHVDNDECNAPGFFSQGAKLLAGQGAQGKLEAETVRALATRRSDVHSTKARAVTLTQSTEVGTVYSLAELEALCAAARELGLAVHMDGARFANACASLGCSPAQMTWQLGVDVLSLGGTKLGTAIGDAVVFFNRELAQEFAYRRKQTGQLASKMRYISAPWLGMLEDGIWLRHARHANAMAIRLAEGLCRLPDVKLLFPVESNAVFVHLPDGVEQRLRDAGWVFHSLLGQRDSRFVCSWATTVEQVDALLADARGAQGVIVDRKV